MKIENREVAVMRVLLVLLFVLPVLGASSEGFADFPDERHEGKSSVQDPDRGTPSIPPPVLDVHLHALPANAQGPPPVPICAPFDRLPVWDPARPYGEALMEFMKEPPCEEPIWSPETDDELMRQSLEMLERHNVIGVLSGSAARVAAWRAELPERLIPGLVFNVADTGLSPQDLRSMHEAGDLEVLGEVTNQYAGIAPDDERMEPYWALAEELDIPVGIHVGPGPPGAIYLGDPGYRARLHSALTLEETLVRHPGLRVYAMHAGFPLVDDLLAMLYAHPQLHVGLGVISFTQPRAELYRFLRRIVDAGYIDRVMFGSDQMVWPQAIERAIETVREAPFLTEPQKRAILYDNAARFLRLSEEEIARHHKPNN